jgi:hypothetical protein
VISLRGSDGRGPRSVYADKYNCEPGGFLRATGRWRRQTWVLDETENVAYPRYEYSEVETHVWPAPRLLGVRDE